MSDNAKQDDMNNTEDNETGEMVQVVDVRGMSERLTANVETVIVGKHHEVQLALIALLCQGHVLLEDVPGVGAAPGGEWKNPGAIPGMENGA